MGLPRSSAGSLSAASGERNVCLICQIMERFYSRSWRLGHFRPSASGRRASSWTASWAKVEEEARALAGCERTSNYVEWPPFGAQAAAASAEGPAGWLGAESLIRWLPPSRPLETPDLGLKILKLAARERAN